MTDFLLELETTQPDVSEDLGNPSPARISLGDNNDTKRRAPVWISIEDAFGDASTSVTLDELTKLRNMLNEAIVWAEGQLAQ